MAPKPSKLAGVDSSLAHSVKAPLTCLTVRQIKIIEPIRPPKPSDTPTDRFQKAQPLPPSVSPISNYHGSTSIARIRPRCRRSFLSAQPTQRSHQGLVAEATAGSQKLLNPPLPNSKGFAEAMGTRKMAPSKNQGASTKPASWPLYRSCAYKPSRNFSTPLPNGKGRDETGSLRNLLKSHRNHQVLPAEGKGTVKSHQGLTVTSRRNQWKTRPLLRTTSCQSCNHKASSSPLPNGKDQAFQNYKPSSTTFTAPWQRLTAY
ncbi:unnamed protein product [Prunus armeniaca]|uniref:Uncharacterized protein n=1 Tax=Prunus armeniaca TaxID=36596 RepID=A0A6J5X463_PRUAR|nr:unnamed protein product [Prunus armeniaca]